MTYYRMLKAAKAANASAYQLALIKQMKQIAAQPLKTRFGVVKRYRDEAIRRKLERWLTALQTDHREQEFWQEVVAQVGKSLGGEQSSEAVAAV